MVDTPPNFIPTEGGTPVPNTGNMAPGTVLPPANTVMPAGTAAISPNEPTASTEPVSTPTEPVSTPTNAHSLASPYTTSQTAAPQGDQVQHGSPQVKDLTEVNPNQCDSTVSGEVDNDLVDRLRDQNHRLRDTLGNLRHQLPMFMVSENDLASGTLANADKMLAEPAV